MIWLKKTKKKLIITYDHENNNNWMDLENDFYQILNLKKKKNIDEIFI